MFNNLLKRKSSKSNLAYPLKIKSFSSITGDLFETKQDAESFESSVLLFNVADYFVDSVIATKAFEKSTIQCPPMRNNKAFFIKLIVSISEVFQNKKLLTIAQAKTNISHIDASGLEQIMDDICNDIDLARQRSVNNKIMKKIDVKNQELSDCDLTGDAFITSTGNIYKSYEDAEKEEKLIIINRATKQFCEGFIRGEDDSHNDDSLDFKFLMNMSFVILKAWIVVFYGENLKTIDQTKKLAGLFAG